jgi:uncharacterized protein GlcG (DUF336 family)
MNRYSTPGAAWRTVLSVLVLSGACTDGPVSPRVNPVPVTGYLTAEYECTADFEAGTLQCGPVSPTGETGARLDVMLTSVAAKAVNVGASAYSGGDKSNPDTMTYNMALVNLIPQSIGTRDGATADTSRLVITGYQTPQYGVTMQLDNADGTATFVDSLNGGTPLTYSNAPYKTYTEIIAPNDTSSAKSYRFVFPSSITGLTLKYRVWTRVQHLHGWVTVTAADSVVGAGQTLALSGASFNAMGTAQPAESYTWASSDNNVATVDNNGGVQGVAGGTVTITATSNVYADRSGARSIVVDEAPVVLSTTPEDNASPVAADADIMILFSEAVNVSANSFLLECPVGEDSQSFTVSGSGTSTITIDPEADLPELAICTVTVAASAVSDADANDGPDVMALDHVFSFEVGITIHP